MTIGGKRIKPDLLVEVRTRLAQLRAMPSQALQAMPESTTTEVTLQGERALLTVYRTPDADKTLVVVQAAHHRWFGITTEIQAAGFVLSPKGDRVDATEEMLWDYL